MDLTKIVVGEVEVLGSRCGPFEPALRLLVGGRMGVESMIDGRFPLDHALEALERAAQPGIRKVLLAI